MKKEVSLQIHQSTKHGGKSITIYLNFTLVSSPSTEDVSNPLTTEEMHQGQPLLSNQTLASTTKTRLETEQTTNTDGTFNIGYKHSVPNENHFVCTLQHSIRNQKFNKQHNDDIFCFKPSVLIIQCNFHILKNL